MHNISAHTRWEHLTRLTQKALLLLSILLLASFFADKAMAQGKYFNVSLDGSYQTTHNSDSNTVRMSAGAELAIPLTDYFDVSIGHNMLMETETYTEEYRQRMLQSLKTDIELPETIERKYKELDTTANAALGYPIGFMKISIFGGKLWRKICREDTFQDQGCSGIDVTWNAGTSLSVYMTQKLRLRITYRLSPSVRTDNKKTYDDLTSVGLTWGI